MTTLLRVALSGWLNDLEMIFFADVDKARNRLRRVRGRRRIGRVRDSFPNLLKKALDGCWRKKSQEFAGRRANIFVCVRSIGVDCNGRALRCLSRIETLITNALNLECTFQNVECLLLRMRVQRWPPLRRHRCL